MIYLTLISYMGLITCSIYNDDHYHDPSNRGGNTLQCPLASSTKPYPVAGPCKLVTITRTMAMMVMW